MNFCFICRLPTLVDGKHSSQLLRVKTSEPFLTHLFPSYPIYNHQEYVRFTCRIHLEFGDFMPPILRPPWCKLPLSCSWKFCKRYPCFIGQPLLRSQIYTYKTWVSLCHPSVLHSIYRKSHGPCNSSSNTKYSAWPIVCLLPAHLLGAVSYTYQESPKVLSLLGCFSLPIEWLASHIYIFSGTLTLTMFSVYKLHLSSTHDRSFLNCSVSSVSHSVYHLTI